MSQSVQIRPWLSLIIILPILVYFVLVNPDWVLFVEIALVLIALPIMILDEERGLLALLFVRPMMDIFGDRTITLFDRYTINLAALLSVVVIVWAIVTLLRRHVHVWRISLFWPMMLVLATAIVGFAGTVSAQATFTETLRFLSIVVLYLLAAALIRTRQSWLRLRNVFVWSLAVPVLVGIYQAVTKTGLQFGDVGNRIYGTFAHPNSFALYLVLILTIVVGWAATKSKKERTPLMFLFLLLFIMLIATYTRGAWIGFCIMIAFVAAFYFRKALIITLLIGGIVLVLYPVVNRVLINAADIDLNRTTLVRRILDKTDDSSFVFRTQLWKDMAPKIREKPIFGHGLGSFTILRERQILDFFTGTEAHNDYLRLAVETGLVGLAAYLLLLGVLFRQLVKTYKHVRTTPDGVVVLSVIGFFLGYLVMSFFDNLLQTTAFQWAMWVMFAAVLMMPGKGIREKE